ncbi:glioma pathogenesis-related protein 1 isoform X3 [Seriola dumerili]|uniref:glioma pathogenesis-related protein 1 isoform X3 n=1 Tax=Seriola dumerili TaxID=41447 RepID=UPI000BBE54AB|nr:glioma pathogenesis-related protein 1 isoform X3 [Seriola dumerili]
MGSRVDLLLWAWIVLDSGVCSVVLPEITDGKFIDECVREHNRARSSVNPPASDMLHMVVWGSSYKVGCAAELCPNGVKDFSDREGVVFVCNYATAGNFNNRRPYETKGAACSGCEGTCGDSLCRDQKRDSQQSYSWTPDWDPSLAATYTGSNYVTILVVRPIGLIFTFITAYAVRHYYPDVFCYE